MNNEKLFGKRGDFSLNIVGKEQIVANMIKGLAQSQGKVTRDFLAGVFDLTGHCHGLAPADILAIAKMAYDLSDKSYGAQILTIAGVILRSRTEEAMASYKTTDDLEKVTELHRYAGMCLREAMKMAREDHPEYALMEEIIGSINRIGIKLNEIEPELQTINRAKAAQEGIGLDLKEAIKMVTSEANKATAAVQEEIDQNEKFLADVVHGDKCSCSCCRLEKLQEEAEKIRASRRHEDGCGCGCHGSESEAMEKLCEMIERHADPGTADFLLDALADDPNMKAMILADVMDDPEAAEEHVIGTLNDLGETPLERILPEMIAATMRQRKSSCRPPLSPRR